MTVGAPIQIGILLNSQTIQLYSVYCITMRGHGPVLHDFVECCDQSYLCLNETKTKDMCIDFRRDPPPQTDTVIHDNAVEMVDEYKYLGTTIDNKLRWDRHCTVTYIYIIRNASSVYTAYESFAPLTLIIPFCPCFINRVSRVF